MTAAEPAAIRDVFQGDPIGIPLFESVQPNPGRWMHHVILLSPDDLDDAVRGWLGRAYLEAGGSDRPPSGRHRPRRDVRLPR